MTQVRARKPDAGKSESAAHLERSRSNPPRTDLSDHRPEAGRLTQLATMANPASRSADVAEATAAAGHSLHRDAVVGNRAGVVQRKWKKALPKPAERDTIAKVTKDGGSGAALVAAIESHKPTCAVTWADDKSHEYSASPTDKVAASNGTGSDVTVVVPMLGGGADFATRYKDLIFDAGADNKKIDNDTIACTTTIHELVHAEAAMRGEMESITTEVEHTFREAKTGSVVRRELIPLEEVLTVGLASGPSPSGAHTHEFKDPTAGTDMAHTIAAKGAKRKITENQARRERGMGQRQTYLRSTGKAEGFNEAVDKLKKARILEFEKLIRAIRDARGEYRIKEADAIVDPTPTLEKRRDESDGKVEAEYKKQLASGGPENKTFLRAIEENTSADLKESEQEVEKFIKAAKAKASVSSVKDAKHDASSAAGAQTSSSLGDWDAMVAALGSMAEEEASDSKAAAGTVTTAGSGNSGAATAAAGTTHAPAKTTAAAVDKS